MLSHVSFTVYNVPVEDDPTTWEFFLAHSKIGEPLQGLDQATILANMKKDCEKMAEPFRTAILEISDDTRIFSDKLYYWIPVPWDNHDGRITLAGDAAHPMPPCK